MLKQKQIEDMAREVRKMFEDMLETSVGTTNTVGGCLHASVLVSKVLGNFLDATTVVRGGAGLTAGGFRDRHGTVHGHYWAEIKCLEFGAIWVVDITADQFEEKPVLVIPLGEARQHIPGDQWEIDRHVDEMLQRRDR